MTALYLERYLNYGLTREELQSSSELHPVLNKTWVVKSGV